MISGRESHSLLLVPTINSCLLFSGRINLVDLQQVLNVDLSHVQSKAAEIVSAESNVTLILGQLVDE